jgi:amino-acid N-acetyltransferase
MIRQAEPRDLPAVLALLADADLPTDGVSEHFRSFFVVDEGGRILASAGIELWHETALLRSLAVAPDARGAGLGAAILRRALHEAQERAAEIFALTTTAEAYLSRFGFARVERDSLPSGLLASRELQGACPDTAVVLRRVSPPRA